MKKGLFSLFGLNCTTSLKICKKAKVYFRPANIFQGDTPFLRLRDNKVYNFWISTLSQLGGVIKSLRA